MACSPRPNLSGLQTISRARTLRTRTPPCLRSSFSTSASRNGYEDTLPNLKIGKHTKVLFQGFTGV